ncbi:MAG: phosphoribosylaminoimidazolesuccinocarboxamide synthase, partial [Myxococcota bacterium]
MSDLQAAMAAQLPHTLQRTDWPDLGERYEGKVRDVYRQSDRIVVVTTDRVSAFDRVLGTVPFKGEILTTIARSEFEATQDVVPNHVLSHPDPNALVAKHCTPYPVEFVVRAYMTGSLWRDYASGAAAAYEIHLPPRLRKDERLLGPILTPSTKASGGEHDAPISKRAIVDSGLMTPAQLEAAEAAALALFARGVARAEAKGLILVDTKYEFGEDAEGQLTVIDEIHTPDSSRYWRAESYRERFLAQRPQVMLDKENLRQWLLQEHGFRGQGDAPKLSEDIRTTLAVRYAELHAALLGRPFEPQVGPVQARLGKNL